MGPQASAKTAVIFKCVRRELDRLLKRKLEDPGFDFGGAEIVKELSRLLSTPD